MKCFISQLQHRESNEVQWLWVNKDEFNYWLWHLSSQKMVLKNTDIRCCAKASLITDSIYRSPTTVAPTMFALPDFVLLLHLSFIFTFLFSWKDEALSVKLHSIWFSLFKNLPSPCDDEKKKENLPKTHNILILVHLVASFHKFVIQYLPVDTAVMPHPSQLSEA